MGRYLQDRQNPTLPQHFLYLNHILALKSSKIQVFDTFFPPIHRSGLIFYSITLLQTSQQVF